MASSSAPTMPSLVVTAGAATAGSSSGSPCAACKFLRRKCQPDCVFAPYFPPDTPHKFVHVHRVFGASNVSKLLNDLHPSQREDAVNSLAYEADMRLRDPVYGCVGIISILQRQLRQLQAELSRAKADLCHYRSAACSAAAAAAATANAAAAAGASTVNFSARSPSVHTSVSTAAAAAGGSQMFSNVNRSMGLTGITFGQDQGLFHGGTSRNVSHHDDLMSRNNYDVALAATFGANDTYDTEIAASLNGATAEAVGLFGGQLMKPSMAGGHDHPAMRPF